MSWSALDRTPSVIYTPKNGIPTEHYYNAGFNCCLTIFKPVLDDTSVERSPVEGLINILSRRATEHGFKHSNRVGYAVYAAVRVYAATVNRKLCGAYTTTIMLSCTLDPRKPDRIIIVPAVQRSRLYYFFFCDVGREFGFVNGLGDLLGRGVDVVIRPAADGSRG